MTDLKWQMRDGKRVLVIPGWAIGKGEVALDADASDGKA